MPLSSNGCGGKPERNDRSPVLCPYCVKAAVVWAGTSAAARDLWVKCKNPACRREFEIKI